MDASSASFTPDASPSPPQAEPVPSSPPSPLLEDARANAGPRVDGEGAENAAQGVARSAPPWRSLRLRPRADRIAPLPEPTAEPGTDPARDAPSPGLDAGPPSRRWAWLEDWRRGASSRWPLIIAGLAIASIVLIFLIVQGYVQARGWLGRQPQFLAKPEELELDPSPPPWLAAGQPGIVRRVKDAARWPASWSALELELAKIADDFRFHCPWAEKVTRVERIHPNRIKVTLQYRVPVAQFIDPRANPRFASSSKTPQTDVILDRYGVILPAADIDPKFRQSLIRFDAMNDDNLKLDILPPQNPRPGTVWGRRDADQPLTLGEKRIVDAAALAWHLRQFNGGDGAIAGGGGPDWLANVVINPTYPDGIFLLVQPRTWAFWGEAIGEEATGTLGADRKREEFFRWARERVAQGPPPDILVYSLRTLRYIDYPEKPSAP